MMKVTMNQTINKMKKGFEKAFSESKDSLLENIIYGFINKNSFETYLNNSSTELFSYIRKMYGRDNTRFYHTQTHIRTLLLLLPYHKEYSNITSEAVFNLIIAILFHDIVYVPNENNNEECSCDTFEEYYNSLKNKPTNILDKDLVFRLIMATKQREYKYNFCKLSKIIHDLDNAICRVVTDRDILLEYETNIKEEYLQVYSFDDYYLGRKKFLLKEIEIFGNQSLNVILENLNINYINELSHQIITKNFKS